MSVLEKKGKGLLDDTIPLTCMIAGFVKIDGHMVRYVLINDSSWFPMYGFG